MVDLPQRPLVPLVHANAVEHRRQLAVRVNASLPKDGSGAMTAPLPLQEVATADLPAAADHEGDVVYDTTTNTVKFSNGTSWVDLDAEIGALDVRITALEDQVGRVVQEVVATSTTEDSTTAETMQDSSLSESITPLFADSVIEVTAVIPFCRALAVAGTPTNRIMVTEIHNATDGVSSPAYRIGRRLTGASAAAAESDASITMVWRYTVNSLTARTFRVRFRTLDATNVQAVLLGAFSELTLTLREIKQ